MCYDISFMERRQEKMTKRYNLALNETEQLKITYHTKAFSHALCYVITEAEPNKLQQFEWGLIPKWCGNETQANEIRKQTVNARSETIFEKNSFRHSILSKRCIIPVSGFFEWFTLDAKRKYPFFIHQKNNELLSLGGIYETWINKESGEVHNTFSIVTTEANSLMAAIHNTKKRMPLILPQSDELKWINSSITKDEITQLMIPFDASLMQAHSITKLITDRNRDNNVEEVIEGKKYPELEILKLPGY